MAATANAIALRLVVAVAASVPVAGGLWGAVEGLDGAAPWSASHHRYLSGLLLAIGLGFWSTFAQIERHTHRFRLLTALVFLGGLCRLAGILAGDPLTPPVAGALAMELIAAPLLCLWQAQVSASTPASQDPRLA